MEWLHVLILARRAGRRAALAKLVKKHLPECVAVPMGDSEEARAYAETHPLACAIIDLDLGAETALAFCREIRSPAKRDDTPVMLLSKAPCDSASRLAGFEAGCDDFIEGDLHGEEFAARVRVLLRNSEANRESRRIIAALVEVAEERSRTGREDQAVFRMIFDHTNDLVLIARVDKGGRGIRLIDANEAACRLLGYTHDELLALRPRQMLAETHLDSLIARVQAVMERSELSFDTVVRNRYEEELPVAVHAHAFGGPEEWTLVCLGSPLSNTRLTLSRTSAHEPYDLLARQVGMVLYAIDMDTGEAEVSGAVTEVLGHTPEEVRRLTPRKYARLVDPADRRRIVSGLRAAFSGLTSYRHEYRLHHPSGKVCVVEDAGIVLPGQDGRARKVMGTIRDISRRVETEEERRRLEQNVQNSQRLESLGVLAGGIAHDFNNILAAIIGLTDMTLDELDPASEAHEDLREVLGAAHRAKELVGQILAFSRQTGEEKSAVLLHIVAQECLQLLRATLPATVDIIDNIDVHSGVVEANTTQIHQVIMNLCTNAAQAMKATRGSLEVRVENTEVSEAQAGRHTMLHPGQYVRLSVHDTGHGMKPEVIERIFDPFFSTKGPGEGTGMGLAVVHGIVSDHGGAITVESVPGRGSSFHIYLPRIASEASAVKGEAKPAPKGTERVLFVDDEEAVLRFAQSALQRLGYEVVLCGNAFEARDRFDAQPGAFDLVITDQMMPKKTGIELAREIHAIRPELPIILFTGFSYQVTDKDVEQAGIREVVLKPIITSVLANAIRRVLDETQDPVPTK